MKIIVMYNNFSIKVIKYAKRYYNIGTDKQN